MWLVYTSLRQGTKACTNIQGFARSKANTATAKASGPVKAKAEAHRHPWAAWASKLQRPKCPKNVQNIGYAMAMPCNAQYPKKAFLQRFRNAARVSCKPLRYCKFACKSISFVRWKRGKMLHSSRHRNMVNQWPPADWSGPHGLQLDDTPASKREALTLSRREAAEVRKAQ